MPEIYVTVTQTRLHHCVILPFVLNLYIHKYLEITVSFLLQQHSLLALDSPNLEFLMDIGASNLLLQGSSFLV